MRIQPTGSVEFGVAGTGFGPLYAASYNIASDRRLKINIENIPNPLEIIDQLNGVRFDWINEAASRNRQVGEIATLKVKAEKAEKENAEIKSRLTLGRWQCLYQKISNSSQP